MMPKLTVDPSLIEMLADLLDRTGLSEIEVAEGDSRVRIVRPATAPAVMAAAAPAPETAVRATKDSPSEGAVLSPMVGTAYLAPEPGAAPFVAVGASVREGQTLLIVEAMKVMNPIRAPRAGTVVEVLVTNAAPVEFGEPLLVLA